MKEVLLIIGVTTYICALAEITVYFVELIVIFGLAIFMTKGRLIRSALNVRRVLLICLGVIAIVFGVRMYLSIFPE